MYSIQFGQTNPGSVCQSFGGVGRNIAGMLCVIHIIMNEYVQFLFFTMVPIFPIDCLSRLGYKPLFISAIGKDSHSDAVLNYCKHMVSYIFYFAFYCSCS